MAGETGYLVLSTGDILEGKWLSPKKEMEGELVFNTAMTGYQEVMTDPSYAGQIVIMTYPLIGNYGFNDTAFESVRPQVAGLIINFPCVTPEHAESQYSIMEMVQKFDIPILYDMDTRRLTTIVRNNGNVFGKMTSNKDEKPIIEKVDPNIVKTVSVSTTHTFYQKTNRERTKHVVVVDFGYKHSIVNALLNLSCHVTVVPYHSTLQEIQALHPDGILFSNGPGNPEDLQSLLPKLKEMADQYPTLGICLGHQLLALAYGGKTKRLPFGHRGSNHPVKDLKTGKVYITSQNHGYVVDEQSLNKTVWNISHINVNDNSVEGMVHRSKPIIAVQFHPEAHPGPLDSHHIFEHFYQLLQEKGAREHAKV
ncbi:carbamoyl phosphate synthase small subunit [Salirhabdus sp. Marseille-P4669]|uniref:carbamoyl phosphate synthase small subunit n=1 Tax=Salirhabdus sp. Marseille-P4669 TaxID=2042310 RepID=UPI000C7B5196|nr:carbamoyl phosphate synthase small subunit [Salirhabdus sp. Marseille-P4669]